GQLQLKAIWKDGLLDGPYEGYGTKGTYKDGVQCGEWIGGREPVTYDPCPPGLEDGKQAPCGRRSHPN
ncbi:MAG: hypothetical protein VX956_08620, partial [Gemmatimonadota bacterium]|nr:hypothetical protein [Gemmatimonadota bacterium]